MQLIYFIASYPRSGNTWVRAMIYELLRRQGAYGALPDDLRPMDRVMPSDITPIYYSRATGLSVRSITPELAAAARVRVHQLMAETATAPLYVKTHAAYGLFGKNATINHRVARGAVYLVRNPVDVAKSLSNFLGMDLAEAVRVMQIDSAAQAATDDTVWDPWSSWGVNARSWMEAANFPVLVVRYEDLRADPAGWLGKIATHAGIATTPDEVESVAQSLTLEKMKAMAETGTLTLPISRQAGTFVGSQLSEPAGGSDDILAPLRDYAPELQRRLGYT